MLVRLLQEVLDSALLRGVDFCGFVHCLLVVVLSLDDILHHVLAFHHQIFILMNHAHVVLHVCLLIPVMGVFVALIIFEAPRVLKLIRVLEPSRVPGHPRSTACFALLPAFQSCLSRTPVHFAVLPVSPSCSPASLYNGKT